METSTTFSAPFLRSLLTSDTNILRLRIYFRVKTTDIENQYNLYSRKLSDGSSMLEVVYLTVSYSPVAGIRSLHIIIAIASVESLILFILDIPNSFHNTILPDPSEIVYLILLYLYLEWYTIKCPEYPLSLINHKELCIQAIKSIQGKKPAVKFWYELLKSIFITVNIIRISSDNDVLSWVYKNYRSFLAVKTHDILLETQNRNIFERLMQILTLSLTISPKKDQN